MIINIPKLNISRARRVLYEGEKVISGVSMKLKVIGKGKELLVKARSKGLKLMV